jgi:ribosome-associated protein
MSTSILTSVKLSEEDLYIHEELKKIIQDHQQHHETLQLALCSAWIMGQLKAINLKVIDVAKQSSLADYFVMASASNPIQARSMSDLASFHLRLLGMKKISEEGKGPQPDWLLLDMGEIIIHIFLEQSREIYDLDGLWQHAPAIDIPNHFYFGQHSRKGLLSSNKEPSDSSISKNKTYF